MGFFLLKRLLLMIPLFIGITIISFGVINLAPGSPIDLATDLNPKATAEVKERMRAFYGLDKPLHIQYASWLRRLVTLDFGHSFSPDGRKVADKILERLPVTVSISLASLGIIFLLAVPLGVLSASYQHSLFDRVTTVLVFIGFAVPHFWLALLLMILFGVQLGWLPISGLKSLNYEYLPWTAQVWDRISHLILPLFVSASGGLAGLSRYMRSNMLEVIRQDYITTARSKGLAPRAVIFKHAMRNALIPLVTLIGLDLPSLFGGALFTETIFAWPGIGRLYFTAALKTDYPIVMAVLIIYSALIILSNLLVDVVYAALDPRIRLS